MKSLLSFSVLAAVLALATPASAYTGTGFNFFNQCGNAFSAGFANRPFCHTYLTGFFDGLASSGQVCSSGVNDVQIVMVVQNWLRNHPQNLQRPAIYMIRNAMVAHWPCR